MHRAIPVLLGFVMLMPAADAAAEEKGQVQPLKRGPHAFTVSLEGEGGGDVVYHDVRVQQRGQRLSLTVIEDLEPGKKTPAGGLGGGDGVSGWKGRQPGQQAWIPRGRQLRGAADDAGTVRFGITFTREGRLVSLHCTGRSTGPDAGGDARLFSEGKAPVMGTWRLHNPLYWRLPAAPGINGVEPGAP